MSVAVEALTKVHQKQVEAVTKSQSAVGAVLDKLSAAVEGVQGKAPAVPEAVAGPAKTLVEPLTKLVGTREELSAYAAQSVRDWAELQQKAQATILDRVAARA